MTTHRFHPDPDRPDNIHAILWDDCDRCYQQAINPIATLDTEKLARLWDRVQLVEFGATEVYPTITEARAAHALYDVYLLASRASTLVGEIQAVADQRRLYRECDACGVTVPRRTWSAHLVTQSHLAADDRSYNVPPPVSNHWTLVKDDGTTLPVRFESIESAESSADLMRDRTGRTWTVQEVAL